MRNRIGSLERSREWGTELEAEQRERNLGRSGEPPNEGGVGNRTEGLSGKPRVGNQTRAPN